MCLIQMNINCEKSIINIECNYYFLCRKEWPLLKCFKGNYNYIFPSDGRTSGIIN